MGKCCKCERYEWKDDPQPEIVFRTGDNDYCVFHAPEGEVWNQGVKKPTVEAFNKRVFTRIKATKAAVAKDATCDLRGTVFPGDISFTDYAKYDPLPTIRFDHATFSGEADFSEVKFGGKAEFDNAVFSGKAKFDEAKFSGMSSFCEAKFGGEVNFREATFGDTVDPEGVDFYKAEFSGKVDFYSATFRSVSRFNDVTFGGEVDFQRATFGDMADFQSCKAADRAVRMHKLSQKSLAHLVFATIDLPLFSFLECRGPTRLGLETHGNGNAENLQACEELYRAMKQRAAEIHDQLQVSIWHFREKLMFKKQRWYRRWLPVTLTWWYWATSGFGERAVRAGIFLAFLVALPFVWNSPSGTATWQWLWSQAAWLHSAAGQLAPLRNAVNATAAMQFIPFTKDIGGEGWMKVAQGIWHLLIIIQGTLFALAVRNRFRR